MSNINGTTYTGIAQESIADGDPISVGFNVDNVTATLIDIGDYIIEQLYQVTPHLVVGVYRSENAASVIYEDKGLISFKINGTTVTTTKFALGAYQRINLTFFGNGTGVVFYNDSSNNYLYNIVHTTEDSISLSSAYNGIYLGYTYNKYSMDQIALTSATNVQPVSLAANNVLVEGTMVTNTIGVHRTPIVPAYNGTNVISSFMEEITSSKYFLVSQKARTAFSYYSSNHRLIYFHPDSAFIYNRYGSLEKMTLDESRNATRTYYSSTSSIYAKRGISQDEYNRSIQFGRDILYVGTERDSSYNWKMSIARIGVNGTSTTVEGYYLFENISTASNVGGYPTLDVAPINPKQIIVTCFKIRTSTTFMKNYYLLTFTPLVYKCTSKAFDGIATSSASSGSNVNFISL